MTNPNQQIADEEPKSLDEAVRLFKGYIRGENGFDELDFKSYVQFREGLKQSAANSRPLTLKDLVQKNLSPEAELAIKRALQEAHDDQVNLHESVRFKRRTDVR